MSEEKKFQCIDCGAPTKYNNGKCTACYSKENGNGGKPSEGEEYIADFLKLYKIKFEEQKPIVGLINDTKKYRVADFYLKDYKVYIEYNGHYRDNREHYDEKIKVYNKNKIPCIHLYPENLGVLDYMLDKRLITVLKKSKLDGELKKYKWFKFKNTSQESMAIVTGMLLLIILLSLNYSKGDRGVLIMLGLVILYQFWKIYKMYKEIFIDEKYPLNKV